MCSMAVGLQKTFPPKGHNLYETLYYELSTKLITRISLSQVSLLTCNSAQKLIKQNALMQLKYYKTAVKCGSSTICIIVFSVAFIFYFLIKCMYLSDGLRFHYNITIKTWHHMLHIYIYIYTVYVTEMLQYTSASFILLK